MNADGAPKGLLFSYPRSSAFIRGSVFSRPPNEQTVSSLISPRARGSSLSSKGGEGVIKEMKSVERKMKNLRTPGRWRTGLKAALLRGFPRPGGMVEVRLRASKFDFQSLPCHLTVWKWLIVKDVTGCCRFVADLLPIKCLIISDVTDVADFKTVSYINK
jgi:hypothetical protein